MHSEYIACAWSTLAQVELRAASLDHIHMHAKLLVEKKSNLIGLVNVNKARRAVLVKINFQLQHTFHGQGKQGGGAAFLNFGRIGMRSHALAHGLHRTLLRCNVGIVLCKHDNACDTHRADAQNHTKSQALPLTQTLHSALYATASNSQVEWEIVHGLQNALNSTLFSDETWPQLCCNATINMINKVGNKKLSLVAD